MSALHHTDSRARDRIDRGRMRQRLVLGCDRSCGVVGDHESRPRTRVTRKERGEPLAELGINESRRPALRDGRDPGNGQREVIEGEAESLPMEVPG